MKLKRPPTSPKSPAASSSRAGLFGPEVQRQRFFEVDVDSIRPNPNQPRKFFDEQQLLELAESIQRNGIVQPLVVQADPENDQRWLLIAGERRLRASRMAGLAQVPVFVSSGNPHEIALIENMQRTNLTPLEEARGVEQLMLQYGYTMEEAGHAVGKGRQWVSSALRLLQLPQDIRDEAEHRPDLSQNLLLQIAFMESEAEQRSAWRRALAGKLTVRQAKEMRGHGRRKPTGQGREVVETASPIATLSPTIGVLSGVATTHADATDAPEVETGAATLLDNLRQVVADRRVLSSRQREALQRLKAEIDAVLGSYQ